MNKFESDYGKVLYCIYTLCQRGLITQDRKAQLKDKLIKSDERMGQIVRNIGAMCEQQVHEQLIMMVDSPVANCDSEQSDENYSMRSVRTLQQHKFHRPKKIKIFKSNFRINESDDDTTKRRHSSQIKG